MVVKGTRSVFLVSVVPATFGPIWPWFRTAQQQFLHVPVFTDPCSRPRAGQKESYV